MALGAAILPWEQWEITIELCKHPDIADLPMPPLLSVNPYERDKEIAANKIALDAKKADNAAIAIVDSLTALTNNLQEELQKIFV